MAVRRGGGDLRQGVEEMIGETRTIMADGLDEEVKILTYVRAEHPDLEGPFLANVHQGRGRYSTAYCKRWCVRMWRVSRVESHGAPG